MNKVNKITVQTVYMPLLMVQCRVILTAVLLHFFLSAAYVCLNAQASTMALPEATSEGIDIL